MILQRILSDYNTDASRIYAVSSVPCVAGK
jgi:predicted peptidase